MDSLSIHSYSFDLSEQIRLSINRFENSTFISLFVQPRQHSRLNKKQLEAIASSPFILIHWESQQKDSILTS